MVMGHPILLKPDPGRLRHGFRRDCRASGRVGGGITTHPEQSMRDLQVV